MKDKKKNIAVFVKNLTSGGAEKQAVLLAKALQDEYNVHFIVFNALKVHQKYLDMLANTDVAIKLFKGGHVKRFIDFCRYLRQHKIHVIFSYLTAANLYACMAGLVTGVKVCTGLRNAYYTRGKRIVNIVLTNLFAKLTVVNCYSGKVAFSKQGFKPSKLHVIPNCFECISPYVEKPMHDVHTIISVGRFNWQKDYDTAIKAISIIKQKCPNIVYRCVGYGEQEQHIRSYVKQCGIDDVVEFHINPDNIPELLDTSDIYLSTSLFEGTSNSIMEALNANLPVVCTNVGDNSYLVHDGENGYLAKTGDYDMIAKLLLNLIENYQKRLDMGRISKEILMQDYSMMKFKEKYEEILNNQL